MAVDTAVQGVQATTIVGSSVTHDLSLFGMFMNADWLVKGVIILLLFASFWSWSIIFDKWIRFKSIRAKANKFETEFWAADALDKFYEKVKKRTGHPMVEIFVVAMDEWFRSKLSSVANTGMSMRLGVRERIAQIMQVARNREMEELEKGLGFLATVGSSAPFVGLFGTVWGIMHSFQSIALSKNTSLAVVAPGIAEALFATAIGLFAAIPAVVAYNKFSGELDRFSGRMEDFSVEFNTLLSRQIDAGA